MTDKEKDWPDEDNLQREPEAKRKAGRPKGYPKSGGKIRGKIPGQKYNDAGLMRSWAP